jgi:hypothetical protein
MIDKYDATVMKRIDMLRNYARYEILRNMIYKFALNKK